MFHPFDFSPPRLHPFLEVKKSPQQMKGAIMESQRKSNEIPESTIDQWLDEMCEKWPSPWVARGKMAEFTNGLLSGKSMANYDWRRIGPPKARFGSKVGYWKKPLVQWIKTTILKIR